MSADNRVQAHWETSRKGKLSIALASSHRGGWDVWALYHGTHDLAPVSQHFAATENGHQNARAYANKLWAQN